MTSNDSFSFQNPLNDSPSLLRNLVAGKENTLQLGLPKKWYENLWDRLKGDAFLDYNLVETRLKSDLDGLQKEIQTAREKWINDGSEGEFSLSSDLQDKLSNVLVNHGHLLKQIRLNRKKFSPFRGHIGTQAKPFSAHDIFSLINEISGLDKCDRMLSKVTNESANSLRKEDGKLPDNPKFYFVVNEGTKEAIAWVQEREKELQSKDKHPDWVKSIKRLGLNTFKRKENSALYNELLQEKNTLVDRISTEGSYSEETYTSLIKLFAKVTHFNHLVNENKERINPLRRYGVEPITFGSRDGKGTHDLLKLCQIAKPSPVILGSTDPGNVGIEEPVNESIQEATDSPTEVDTKILEPNLANTDQIGEAVVIDNLPEEESIKDIDNGGSLDPAKSQIIPFSPPEIVVPLDGYTPPPKVDLPDVILLPDFERKEEKLSDSESNNVDDFETEILHEDISPLEPQVNSGFGGLRGIIAKVSDAVANNPVAVAAGAVTGVLLGSLGISYLTNGPTNFVVRDDHEGEFPLTSPLDPRDTPVGPSLLAFHNKAENAGETDSFNIASKTDDAVGVIFNQKVKVPPPLYEEALSIPNWLEVPGFVQKEQVKGIPAHIRAYRTEDSAFCGRNEVRKTYTPDNKPAIIVHKDANVSEWKTFKDNNGAVVNSCFVDGKPIWNVDGRWLDTAPKADLYEQPVEIPHWVNLVSENSTKNLPAHIKSYETESPELCGKGQVRKIYDLDNKPALIVSKGTKVSGWTTYSDNNGAVVNSCFVDGKPIWNVDGRWVDAAPKADLYEQPVEIPHWVNLVSENPTENLPAHIKSYETESPELCG
ncbi:MAG: hypothetical protein CMO81_00735, partial [Waddliaceae bacterium]|nr:hypothetical protein [Waddliaceae bacterium]